MSKRIWMMTLAYVGVTQPAQKLHLTCTQATWMSGAEPGLQYISLHHNLAMPTEHRGPMPASSGARHTARAPYSNFT